MSGSRTTKKPVRAKHPKDASQLAAAIVRLSTESDDEITEVRDPVKIYLASIGSKGGKKGGGRQS